MNQRPPPPTKYLLDMISAPCNSAYGVRRLTRNYSGPLINVRRSSDNAVRDIFYLSNGGLDIYDLLSFVGSGNNGFVTTIYDQSQFKNNGTQATAAAQPQIVTSGALFTQNNLPSMRFYNGSQYLQCFKFAQPSTNFSHSTVFSTDSVLNNTANCIGDDGYFNGGGYYIQIGASNGAVFNISTGGNYAVNYGGTAVAATLSSYILSHISTNFATATLNGNSGSSTSTGSWTTGPKSFWMLGSYQGPTVNTAISLKGYISEHYSFGVNLNPNDRAMIQRNQYNYYKMVGL